MGQRKTFEERCDEVYAFFMDFYFKNHIAPSYNDMTTGTGVKQRGNVAVIINKLVEDGKIVRKGKTSRGLWPAKSAVEGSVSIHLAGHIAADNVNPMVVLDMPDSSTTLEVPKYLLPAGIPPSKLYALQVHGSSMSAANILDEDYVVIHSEAPYHEGDIVAILIKGENAATLKVFEKTTRGSAKLQPKSHDPRHKARIEDPENIIIQGRVVAVMRKC